MADEEGKTNDASQEDIEKWAAKMISMADNNEDGRVTREEFYRFCVRSHALL